MLQIISGKLFFNETGHINTLKGVLYTNLVSYNDSIHTAIGRLIPLSNLRNTGAIICEIDEHIQDPTNGPGMIASHGLEPFITEFAAIISFTLNAVCTPNPDLAKRLTSEVAGIGINYPPKKYISRIYENEIFIRKQDEAFLETFTKKLIDLPRAKYLVAIRAIRTYVTSTHRMSDDLELAYTLLVASIESLAQKFDGHEAVWSDYAQEKKAVIDKSLDGADENVAKKVREAILRIEHVSLGKRFRSFSLDHLPESFFKEDVTTIDYPIGRIDLGEALRHAYDSRSNYIHELLALPRELTSTEGGSDATVIDNKTTLTFQGLSRVARQVIIEFVNRQKVVLKEPYDYRYETPGVLFLNLSPEIWITDANHINQDSGQKTLEGFLHIVSQSYKLATDDPFPDLRPVLNKALSLLPNMNDKQKRPYLILCCLWNYFLKHEYHVKIELSDKTLDLINGPSIESLCAHAITGRDTEWSTDQHQKLYFSYFKKRETPTGLRVLKELEACMGLALAERFRKSDDDSAARVQLALVADNHPKLESLRDLNNTYEKEQEIPWLKYIYPPRKPKMVATLDCEGL